MKFRINYCTNLPLTLGSPSIELLPESIDEFNKEYTVKLIDQDTGLEYDSKIKGELSARGPYQYVKNWAINIYEGDKLVHHESFNPEGKTVFIKMDARALGDNLAWISSVEEFRIKNKCNVVCSTFWNDLFVDVYPNILFVEPNTKIKNVYAQYYIGTHDKNNLLYQPSSYLNTPLQYIACDILNLPRKKIKPKVKQPLIDKKHPKRICISEFTSSKLKNWNNKEGWQELVNKLDKKGYEIVIISKEKTKLYNCIDKTGNLPILDRIKDLSEATYFIGCSSGLSWLAHACGCHVFLISDFTPPNHEFEDECTRIYNEKFPKQKIEYTPIKHPVSKDTVIQKILSKLE